MKIQSNITRADSFRGHGVKHVSQVMNKLYDAAYRVGNNFSDCPEQIIVSAVMKDGADITAVANFLKGKYVGLTFDYKDAQYRNEFCQTVVRKYNEAVTKGKAYK